MKFESINKRFTEKVAAWMAKGYYINSSTMGGSQGEISKIDLTDGNEIIRILLTQESKFEKSGPMAFHRIDVVTLTVGRALEENHVYPNSSRTWDTLWNNRLDVLETEDFYKIDESYDGEAWYGTKEEACKANDKRLARYNSKSSEKPVESAKAKEILLKAIRKRPGMKSVRPGEIKSVTRRSLGKGFMYCVKVRNKVVNVGHAC